MRLKNRKLLRFLKWLGAIAAVGIILLTGLQIFFDYYLDSSIRTVTQNVVANATFNMYKIEIGKAHYSFINRSISYTDINIYPDSAEIYKHRHDGDSIHQLFYFKAKALTLTGIDFNKLRKSESIKAKSLRIISPNIHIHSDAYWKDSDSTEQEFSFKNLIPEKFNSVAIKNLVIDDATVKLTKEEGLSNKEFIIDHFYVNLSPFNINNQHDEKAIRNRLSKDLVAEIRDYSYNFPDSSHRIKISSAAISENKLTIKLIRIEPLNEDEKIGHIHCITPLIEINGIHAFDLIKSDSINISSIKIAETKMDMGKSNAKEIKDVKFDLINLMPKGYRSVKVDSIDIVKGYASFFANISGKSRKISLKPFKLTIRDFNLDTALKKHPFLYAEDIQLSTGNIELKMPDKNVILKTGRIWVNTATAAIRVNDIHFTPIRDKEAYGKKLGHEVDWIKADIKSATLSGLDFKAFVHQNALIANKLKINNLVFYDYRDKRLPDDKTPVPLPAQAIRNAKGSFHINVIEITNSEITYEEFSDKASNSGTIAFKNLNGTITNFGNRNSANIKVYATANLNGKGNIKAETEFKKNNQFYVSTTVKDLPFTAFNSMVSPSMGINLKEGHIEELKVHFNGDNTQTKGEMAFRYKDLKIDIINKETGSTKGVKQSVSSFIINTMLLQSDNPKKGQDLRKVEVNFTRFPDRAFTNYVWNTVLDGIIKSVGVADVKEKQQKRQEKRQDKRDKKNKDKA